MSNTGQTLGANQIGNGKDRATTFTSNSGLTTSIIPDPYLYAVSGLPPGLVFDPATRTVSGTPTESGAYAVTYVADDFDSAYSGKASPTVADLADGVAQTFEIRVAVRPPAVDQVRTVSAPTHDGERNDGIFDTYVRGDRIPIDVGFSEAPGGGLGMPVDCELGTNCWIVNYPDAGAGAQRLDFRCNHLTYDGHKGTDFAVRDLASMYRGVTVVAAADGRILRVRDGVSDDGQEGVPDDRACGNGIVIAHDDGWETQYCHLRKWSVAVQPGEAVHRGQTLGLVGMSGRAEFPHVQLGIRRDGTPLDPFTGKEVGSGCGMVERSLWHADSRPPYQASQFVAAGFATGAVKMDELQRDATSPSALGTDAPALVLWVVTLGLEPGDLLSLSIEGPDGNAIFLHEEELERTQIRRLDYGGRRVRGDGWAPGVYVGKARLRRPSAGGGAERSIRIEVTLR